MGHYAGEMDGSPGPNHQPKTRPILPCPFCGERSITISYFHQPATKLAMSCPACLAMGQIVDRWEDPLKAWNDRRTPIPNGNQ